MYSRFISPSDYYVNNERTIYHYVKRYATHAIIDMDLLQKMKLLFHDEEKMRVMNKTNRRTFA